ncbi:MAG: leucine-rich repeat protein [bacterium]|nr:leucine-rich repeat protein [bacterium]
MNHFTRIFAVLAMVATTATGFAHNFEEGGIYYNINTDETSVTVTYQGNSWSAYPDEYTGAVVIPASVVHKGTTYAVTMIGQYAFKKCVGLTSVSIPNSVTQLSQYAFEGCN